MSANSKAKQRRPDSWWQYLGDWGGVFGVVVIGALTFAMFAFIGNIKSSDISYAQEQSATRLQFVRDFQSRTPAERQVVAQFLIELDKQGSGFDAADYGDNTIQQLQHTVTTGSVPAINTYVAPVNNWTNPIIDYWYVGPLLFMSLMLGFGAATLGVTENGKRVYYLADLPRGFVRRILFLAVTPAFWPFYLVSIWRKHKRGFAASKDTEIVPTAS